MAAGAIEIHRDLEQSRATLAWNRLAEPVPADRFTGAMGVRHAVLASSLLHAGNLDCGLTTANHALTILSTVKSARAHTLHAVTAVLQRWPPARVLCRTCARPGRVTAH